ncbi:hypothetical protein DE146DRAFT_313146 [Phaeosphaeria sp. MPI-PUGE-AT-0046c]|nr:hypothetical protein DE146DRAFT_313146 [Phaeosphaeria sp. MPI-PUGE-AT-0046c]
MCYYRLYIFLGCGHSTSSTMPVSFCATATNAANLRTQEEPSPIPAKQDADHNIFESDLDLEAVSESDITEASRNSLGAAQVAENSTVDKPECPASKSNKPWRKSKIQPCDEGRVHPLHTVRLERVCACCAFERDERLRALDSTTTEIRIKPKRWQVKQRGKVLTSPQQGEINRRSGGSIGGIASVLGQRIDSGVWTVGARWMRDRGG